jgi:hypothetical protein
MLNRMNDAANKSKAALARTIVPGYRVSGDWKAGVIKDNKTHSNRLARSLSKLKSTIQLANEWLGRMRAST